MKKILLAAFVLFSAQAVYAADMSCVDKAKEKNLHGAAETSFVKKCEKDATAAAQKSCDMKAKDKKLSGAAKTSFTTKCVKDATAMM